MPEHACESWCQSRTFELTEPHKGCMPARLVSWTQNERSPWSHAVPPTSQRLYLRRALRVAALCYCASSAPRCRRASTSVTNSAGALRETLRCG
eukprot:2553852-Pleurochrysis_carterae.AAC.1